MNTFKIVFLCACLLMMTAAGCNKNKSRANESVIHKIVISGMKFHPAELTVAIGDTVIWVNHDLVTHNVTAYPGKEWTSGPMARGTSWKTVITKEFEYFCSIHPVMKGKIKIKK